MQRRRLHVFAVCLLLLTIPLLGCDFIAQVFQTKSNNMIGEEGRKKQVKKWAKEAEVEAGIERAEGNYKLTFTGEPPGPWAGSFDPVNRTPAMLTATTFTAREVNKFMSGADLKVAVQAKDTWTIDATRSGNKIEGTATFVRWRDEGRVEKFVDAETGEATYESAPPGAYPALTVTCDGALKAIVAEDGTVAGTVEGTLSNSEGFSKPFKWEFTGDPAK
jgi:hypothetical protein